MNLSDKATGRMFALNVGMGGERAGPSDVAMAAGVEGVAGLTERPFSSGVAFAKRKIIGGDVLIRFRQAFLRRCELIHEGKAEGMLFGGEIDLEEATGKLAGGLPANLTTEA